MIQAFQTLRGKPIRPLKTNLTVQRSDRLFKIWEYQISHGQLLIRSPQVPASGTSPGLLTNVDLVCMGVDYMAVPRVLHGIDLVAPTPDEIQHLELLLGVTIAPEHIKIVASSGQRFPIVASSFSLVENDWDIFESPFEFRSQYRCEP